MSAAKQGGDWPILRPPVDHGEVLTCAPFLEGAAQGVFPTHVNPEPRSSRSSMASLSVKGRVRTTRKPTEFYVCLRTDPQAEVHDHLPPRGYPNFTITKRVGLWARAHLN